MDDFDESLQRFRVESDSPSRKQPYVHQPFPTDLDAAVDDLIDRFQAASPRGRLELWKALQPTRRHSQTLLAYAQRAATQAIRQQDVSFVLRGLIALQLEGKRYDRRETIIQLTLLCDAASRLGASCNDLFGQVARLAPELSASETIRKYRERRPEIRTIESMGYELRMTGEGIAYTPDQKVWGGPEEAQRLLRLLGADTTPPSGGPDS